MNSSLLNELYEQYQIATYRYGKVSDKLGDVYEAYCKRILEDRDNLVAAIKAESSAPSVEFNIFKSILTVNGIVDFENIIEINCSEIVPRRLSRGLAKTDVIIKITYKNGTVARIPISCKQSYAPRVALAEFDVDTICSEVGIDNETIKALMLLHQTDASAKSIKERGEVKKLRELLAPYNEKFVRWVLTGNPDKAENNMAHPISIIKFKVKAPAQKNKFDLSKGELQYESYDVYTMDEYIKKVMLTKKGKPRVGGFGTGLQWTYATSSKGKKIQFKG